MGSRSTRVGATVGLSLTVALTVGPGPAVGADRAFTIRDPRIAESSGLARSRAHADVVWTVNDSDGRSQVFAVDVRTGKTVGVHDFGTDVRDVEALAIGPDGTMYVADIGDNTASHPFVRIFWFPEPDLGDTTGSWASWELVYPQGPRDAETLLVDPDSGSLVIVAKDDTSGGAAGVFSLPARPSRQGVNTLTRVGDAPAQVTDGVWLQDGSVVLRGYLQLWRVDPSTWSVTDQTLAPLQPQGETVAAGEEPGSVLVGSEGVRSAVIPAAVPGFRPTRTAPSSTPTSTAPSSTPPQDLPSTAGASAAATRPGGRGTTVLLGAVGGVLALLAGGLLVRRRRGIRAGPSDRLSHR